MSASDEEKMFIMKHVFKNVSSYEELRIFEGNSGRLPTFILSCRKNARAHWEIVSEVTLKVLKTDGTWATRMSDPYIGNMMPKSILNVPDGVLGDYLVDGRLSIEMEVKIKKEKVYGSSWLRKFDDDEAKEFSDVVLLAGTQEFHVNKMYLSLHSAYFKSLFSSLKLAESPKKSIIKLEDVHPMDLQSFLEVLYGEPAISDYSVERLLLSAEFLEAKTVTRRCEEFLEAKSRKSRKRKFETAVRFDLEFLKRKCIDEAKTTDEIRELAPENADELEPKDWKELFLKACSSK
ncbi:unnamed protein product [Caenorhabditis nigoni]